MNAIAVDVEGLHNKTSDVYDSVSKQHIALSNGHPALHDDSDKSLYAIQVVFRTISSHVRAVRSFNTSDDKAKSAALNERTHELAGHVKASQKHLGRISAQRTAYAKVDERVPEITSRAIILKDVIAKYVQSWLSLTLDDHSWLLSTLIDSTTSTFQRLFRDFDDVHNKKVKLVNEANETLEELKALHGWYSMFLQSYKMLSFELPRRLTEQERIKNRISELIATVDAEINAEQEKRHAFFESFGKYLPPALQDSLEEQSALMVPVLSWRPFNQVVEHSRTLPEGW